MQEEKTAENMDKRIEEMFQAGAQYGYGKSRRHPSVLPFIYATRPSGDVINLEKTAEMLKRAGEFAEKLGKENKTLLFVGTKPEAKETIKSAAESLSLPYVSERWIGGTLTNFPEIRKRITELENYKKEKAEGSLEKYTKKERALLAKKMQRLSLYFEGLLGVKKLPMALFVVDAKTEHTAVKEAKMAGIGVIALTNSDTDISELDYPVLGNDATIPSIRYFTGVIAEEYKKGRASAPVETTAKEVKEQ